MGALVAQARLSAPAPEEISCGTSAVRGSRPSSTEAAAVTSYLVTRFAVLSMSYLGWPVQVLASVLSYLSSILMCRARQRLKQLVAGRPAKVARRLGEEMAVASKSNGRVNALTKFLVRLKNLPPSDEYFVNKRGRILHVRSYLPSDPAAIRAVIVFSHGYGAHCNSPRKHQMGLAMPQQGLAMFQMDLEGHGYSEGERAYIDHYSNWVDDFQQLLELVAGDGARSPAHGTFRPNHHFAATEAQCRRLREVPIFVAGESLGGALSIMLGLRLQETNHPLLPRFKGEVLLAPAIRGNPPSAMVVLALRYFVAPLIPRWQIPSFLDSVNRPDKCVLELNERRHAEHDVLGYPGGLGWGGNMRFRTGLNMIDLTNEVSRKLEHVAFPFLIMHDPDDNIVRYDYSKELTFKASTPKCSPRGRELRPMEGWLHCLLTNCPEITIQHLSDWVLYQTALWEESARLATQGDAKSAGMTDRRRPPGSKTLPPSFPARSINVTTSGGVDDDSEHDKQLLTPASDGLDNGNLAATMVGLRRARTGKRASRSGDGNRGRKHPIGDMAIMERERNGREGSPENAAQLVPIGDLFIESPSRRSAALHVSLTGPGLTPVACEPELPLPGQAKDGSAMLQVERDSPDP